LVGLPTIKQAVGVKPKPGLKFDPRAFLAKPGEGRAAPSYATGQVIFAQGDPADAVFYVQSGRVKLSIGAKKRWSGSIRPPISSVKRA
jgi:CRP-like cAMP-binding protein